MKLTVLGNYGPFPAAGGACSGYLINERETNILVDCGNGVLSNLQRYKSFEMLDAIILTHLHSDHISDMYVLKYAMQIKRKRGQTDKLINVYAPPEPTEEFAGLDIKDAFALKSITPDTKLNIGNISLEFARMKHPYMDFAVAMESGGKKLVFSGDTSWTDAIISFAAGADLLMLDAGLLERDFAEGAAHLTASQCGIAAMKAGAKRLLLTHFWPEYDINELLGEARRSFANTEASQILKEYKV